MGMAGGGMLLWEPSWLDPGAFCLWTMLGGALSTLELRGGGNRESGGARGRGSPPALGGGGGIPVKSHQTVTKPPYTVVTKYVFMYFMIYFSLPWLGLFSSNDILQETLLLF